MNCQVDMIPRLILGSKTLTVGHFLGMWLTIQKRMHPINILHPTVNCIFKVLSGNLHLTKTHNMRHFLSSTLALLLLGCSVKTADTPTAHSPQYAGQLKQLNQHITKAALNKDFQSIAYLYDENTLLLAEYQPMLDGIDLIKQYYNESFQRQDLTDYNRQTMEINDLGAFVLEIGLFDKTFADGRKVRGKYFSNWKKGQDGDLSLRAECFGFFGEPENKEIFRIEDLTDDHPPLEGRNGLKIPTEMQAYNALGENNVRDRDTKGVVNSYTKDGIYFPFADTAKVGYNELLTHFTGYHAPPAKIDSIEVWTHDFDVIDDGYIRYNKFYVKWTLPNGYTGETAGAGIVYWKRHEDGSLKKHRQVGTHILNL